LELLGPERKEIYESYQDLQESLDKLGIGDARIVLWNRKPYQFVPSDEHNGFRPATATCFHALFGQVGRLHCDVKDSSTTGAS
jgi:hypothetical protein